MAGDKWQIVSGPRQYTKGADGADIRIGWAWDIEPVNGGERQVVKVEVAPGGEPPDDLRPALRARGKPILADFLDADKPPTRILISETGIYAS